MERFLFRKARVLLQLLIMFVYCFVNLNLLSMTTPRYLAESVSEMGVSWIKIILVVRGEGLRLAVYSESFGFAVFLGSGLG